MSRLEELTIEQLVKMRESEGKPAPDYTKSDYFSVTASLSATVTDVGFAMFVQSIQQELPEDGKLTVFDILTLCEVRDGLKHPKEKSIAQKLVKLGYLEKRGKTNAIYYILPRRYYEMTNNLAEYSNITDWDAQQVFAVLVPYLQKYGKAKRSDISKIIGTHTSDKQLRNHLEKLVSADFLRKDGIARGTTYYLGKRYLEENQIINEAIKIGLDKMQEEGKIFLEVERADKRADNSPQKG